MAVDNRVDPPEQPKTVTLPKAERTEILFAELKSLMVNGFKELDDKIDRLEANLDLQGGEIGLVKKEVAIFWEWKGDVEQRLKNNSQRAQGASQVDMDQAAQLAQERAAREALAAKVDSALAQITDQSRAMGIYRRGLDWLVSKDGRATAMRVATAIAAGYTAVKQLGWFQ